MPFEIALSTPENLGPVEHDPIEPWEGDLQVFAIEVCEPLDDAGVRFSAGGFGEEHWRVDVQFDLSSIIPQLPDFLEGLRNGAESELDFCEQGTQRVVTAHPTGESVTLSCRPYFTAWKPDPEVEKADRTDFTAMVEKFTADLGNAIAAVLPELAELEPVISWRALRPGQ
ncbi:hypothetical protein HUT16_18920 [Kitasatospora sp. NA04385]|uniref:hypothetical protein n=1 Tax=Kitasatospora sp. NA04385 TaxID=2742135 RepID=UPI0015905DE8|nr:hypothetical protein [Kitasatospora sp. NA04385]QKW20857.1 hypothetical protein HUT16_18920 [Kitasatospora sp. NA04385]